MTIKKLKNVNLSGFKLLLPSVCVGNVAQLSTDLFIESLKMEKYALLWNEGVIPIYGPSAFTFDKDEVTTASEMFVCEKNKLVILQTRTPVVAALLLGYINEVFEFVQSENISEVIILTSAYSYEQHFVEKSPYEYLSNELMKRKEFPGFNESPADFRIPGCGYAKHLHQRATELNIPSVIFYKYVSEGDNVPDALQFCEKVNEVLKVIPVTENKIDIKIPHSWKNFFGSRVKTEIY
ncbi:CLUMA_CG017890, isoform A [Clunio marinus]|uniref:Proteasome assembly chaperone 2 n=1 Tax=Clunio marinus TaxID=568069 RepID=A0A1J1IXB0_9DIPT|nr:CLUMA_CG017890, isoform A [Clunio marinus]